MQIVVMDQMVLSRDRTIMSTELIARLPTEQLGGARVFRPTEIFGRHYQVNEIVPQDVLQRIKKQNLRALLDQRFLVAWPVGANPTPTAVAVPDADTDAEVFVSNRIGTNRYDVIVGQRLNDEPLTKAEADAVAARHRRKSAA